MEARDVKRGKEGRVKGHSLVGLEIESERPCSPDCFSERFPHMAGSDLRLTRHHMFMSEGFSST